MIVVNCEIITMAYPHHFQYFNLDPSAQLDGFLDLIEKIRLVKTYYISEGRNAWHSTWNQTYVPHNSLYSSLDEAKRFAEKNRKPGSVFYINLIPGILIKTQKCDALVIQINSKKPFSQYSLHRVDKKFLLNNSLKYKRLRIFLRRGVPLNIALKTFEADGENWLDNQSLYNNIIIEYGYECDVVWDDFGSDECVNYQSYAQGSQYNLGWTQSKDRSEAASAAKLIVNKANKMRRVVLHKDVS